jgi:hypothetical protein
MKYIFSSDHDIERCLPLFSFILDGAGHHKKLERVMIKEKDIGSRNFPEI